MYNFSEWFVFNLLGLPEESQLAAALQFFLYDSVKIILLLFVMISLIGFLRTFLPASRMKRWFGKQGITANLPASLFGALTPFCSCSSINKRVPGRIDVRVLRMEDSPSLHYKRYCYRGGIRGNVGKDALGEVRRLSGREPNASKRTGRSY